MRRRSKRSSRTPIAEPELAPKDIDTGAVILTGEALRRENAQAISAMLSEAGGDLVCATAGHHMESMLAAYGSGAALRSSEEGGRILNIDIGGGTTKLALVEGGRVLATAAVHIGGRLLVVDGQGRIVRLDPAGRAHAKRAGLDWKLGDIVDDAALDRVAETMADTLVAALTACPMPADVAHLYLTDPLSDLGGIKGVVASGGVAEYIYGREARDFGDMGRRLGRAVRKRFDQGALPWPLLPAGECIRATALGASEYSVQLSGNTSYISDPGALLPRRNLQVLQPPFTFAETVDAHALAQAIRAHRVLFDAEGADAEIALAFRWLGPPSYQRIHAFAEGIASGLADKVAAREPIYVMLDGDVAHTLGAILREDCGVLSEILVIDGVVLMDFDYIDLGRVRVPSYTVPVTIKSLVFSDDPKRTRERIHHHDHDHAARASASARPRVTVSAPACGGARRRKRGGDGLWNSALHALGFAIASSAGSSFMADVKVSEELAKKFATEKDRDTPYQRWVRAEGLEIISGHYVPNLRTCELQRLAAPRRARRLHQSRRLAHLERLLCLRNPARQIARAPAPALRGDDPRARRPRLDLGLERFKARASPSSGRRARCSRSRSIAGTSISTARAASPPAMSR